MKRKNKRMKIMAIALSLLAIAAASKMSGKSDSYIRNRVVKLTSPAGSCSGEQVRAPSGKDYILTAGHCGVLKVDGSIMAITEDGRKLNRRIIAEDPTSDLLLLEGIPSLNGLEIAKDNHRLQKIRSFTHGKGFPTYITHGVIVVDDRIEVLVSEGACPNNMPKYSTVTSLFGQVCVLSVDETVTSAGIVPGSSGGPIVDSSGDIVGVASATDNMFGYLVRLQDIQKFINNY